MSNNENPKKPLLSEIGYNEPLVNDLVTPGHANFARLKAWVGDSFRAKLMLGAIAACLYFQGDAADFIGKSLMQHVIVDDFYLQDAFLTDNTIDMTHYHFLFATGHTKPSPTSGDLAYNQPMSVSNLFKRDSSLSEKEYLEKMKLIKSHLSDNRLDLVAKIPGVVIDGRYSDVFNHKTGKRDKILVTPSWTDESYKEKAKISHILNDEEVKKLKGGAFRSGDLNEFLRERGEDLVEIAGQDKAKELIANVKKAEAKKKFEGYLISAVVSRVDEEGQSINSPAVVAFRSEDQKFYGLKAYGDDPSISISSFDEGRYQPPENQYLEAADKISDFHQVRGFIGGLIEDPVVYKTLCKIKGIGNDIDPSITHKLSSKEGANKGIDWVLGKMDASNGEIPNAFNHKTLSFEGLMSEGFIDPETLSYSVAKIIDLDENRKLLFVGVKDSEEDKEGNRIEYAAPHAGLVTKTPSGYKYQNVDFGATKLLKAFIPYNNDPNVQWVKLEGFETLKPLDLQFDIIKLADIKEIININ